MIDIQSYLRFDQGKFVPFKEVDSYGGDCVSVPGSIVFVIDGIEVLSQNLWTDVNWLWVYVVQTFDACRNTGVGVTNFPDQPIEFRAEAVGSTGQLEVSTTTRLAIDNRSKAPAEEIYQAVAEAGLEAFDELSRFCTTGTLPDYEDIIGTIKSWNLTD